jgi:hypothetical protein
MNLTNLNMHLFANKFGEVGAANLGKDISKLKNLTILNLNISCNKFTYEGTS